MNRQIKKEDIVFESKDECNEHIDSISMNYCEFRLKSLAEKIKIGCFKFKKRNFVF